MTRLQPPVGVIFPGGERTRRGSSHRSREPVAVAIGLLLAALAIGSSTADAQVQTLTSGNSTVEIDPHTISGARSWVVDGVPQLNQQWYWLRVGSSGPETPLSSLGLQLVTGGGWTVRFDYAGVVGGVLLQIDLTYTLAGGSADSGESQLYELMHITAPLERSDVVVHLFRYADLDLAGSSGADRAAWLPPDTMRQVHQTTTAEAVATPAPAHFGMGLFPSILSSLTDVGTTTLADAPPSLGPGNLTFAVQWDLPLPTRSMATASHTTRISTPSLSIGDVTVSKPTTGTRTADFPLTLSGTSPQPVTVDFATTDGTALAGTDYAAASGSVTIPAGATSVGIGVLVYGNRVFRDGRNFFVGLSNPSNATLSDAQGEAVLSDPNPAGLSIDDVAMARGSAPATARFTVTLSPVSASTVTVDYATADGSASAGVDYTATSGTLTFAPGTVDLPIDVTASPEGAASGVKTFFVNLSGASGAAIAYAQGQATLSDPGYRTLTPCRLVDTRGSVGPLGGPALKAGTVRSFLVAGACGVPPSARAIALNVTVTGSTAPGNVRLFAAGTPAPLASTVNYPAGLTRANNAVAPLGARGELAVLCTQVAGSTAHVILDLVGYFE